MGGPPIFLLSKSNTIIIKVIYFKGIHFKQKDVKTGLEVTVGLQG